MFDKKTYIFSETMGVCRVKDIAKLPTANKNMLLYYELESVGADKHNSYIPVENHQVALRELISVENAKELLESGKELTVLEKAEAEFVINREESQEGKKKNEKSR